MILLRQLKKIAIIIAIFLALNSFVPFSYFLSPPGDQENKTNKWPRSNNIAVVAVTAPADDLPFMARSKCFHFYLPFVIAAWRRLGYSTFVIVIGSDELWYKNGTYLNYIIKIVENELDGYGYFHFIDTKPTETLSYAKVAQIIRLFAADMEPLRKLDKLYLITADVDWLPIKDIFQLPSSNFAIRASIPPVRTFSTMDNDVEISKLD